MLQVTYKSLLMKNVLLDRIGFLVQIPRKTFFYKIEVDYNQLIQYQHLAIPFWLLGVDDIALLLNANDENQIPIIEKALKLVSYFTRSEDEVIDQKNDILARSILDIIFSGKNPSEIRNKLTSNISCLKKNLAKSYLYFSNGR